MSENHRDDFLTHTVEAKTFINLHVS